jgi:ubiquitin-protein ligase
MLNCNIIKNNKTLLKSNSIEYLLVNWCIINSDAYLTNFKYLNNLIFFDAVINSTIWCFVLDISLVDKTIFKLKSTNSELSDEQIILIDKFNNILNNYDYFEFNNFINLTNIKNYNIQSSILIIFLNQLNDECAIYDEEYEEDEDVESNKTEINNVSNTINETIIQVNMDEIQQHNIPVKDSFQEDELENSNDLLDKYFDEYINDEDLEVDLESSSTKYELDEQNNEDDIWDDNDDNNTNLKIKFNTFFLDFEAIKKTSFEYLNNNIKKDINKNIFNFNDESRILMLINEVQNINKKYSNILVTPNNNNIFDLEVKMTSFISLDDIFINIKLDSNLYPYYPPKISFNVAFEDNLSYLILELDYFKVSLWNPTNSLDHTLISIWNILDTNAKISIDKYVSTEFTQLLNDLSVYSQIAPLNISKKNINIKFTNINMDSSTDKFNGTGYGMTNSSVFDIKKYINSIELKNKTLTSILEKMKSLIESNIDTIKDSCLLPFISNYMQDIQLLEVNKYNKLYTEIFNIVDILINDKTLLDYEFNNTTLFSILNTCNDVFDTYTSINSNLTDIELQLKQLLENYNKLDKKHDYKLDDNLIVSSNETKYLDFVKNSNFEVIDNFKKSVYIPKDSEPNKYCKNIARIAKEMSSLKTSITPNWGSNIFIKCNKENMSLIKVAITGPKDTPYENGFFEFHIKLGENYPENNPACHFQTTDGGKIRFNPNLYECGKVCLSLLGTWRGDESEKWNKSTSSILQLLISIQSLILCEQPYFNEPGYASSYGTKEGTTRSNDYNKIRQTSCINVAIIKQIENPPDDFQNVIYGHFHFKREEILKNFDKWSVENKNLEKLKPDLIKALDKATAKFLEQK